MAPDEQRPERLAELIAISLADDDKKLQDDEVKINHQEMSKQEQQQQQQHENEPIDSRQLINLANSRHNSARCYGACEQRRPPAHAEDGPTPSSSSACSLSGDDSLKSLKAAATAAANNEQQVSLIERLAKWIPGLGIILALCASVFLGTAGMLVKLTYSVHGIQVAVFRAMIQMVIYGTLIGLRGDRTSWLPARGEWIPVGLRALLGGSSITFSYYALKLIPLGDATTIRFSLPIWTLIMSYFFLGESCSLFKITAVVTAVCGVVLIAKPDDCLYLLHLLLRSLGFESTQEFYEHKHEYELNKEHEIAHLLSQDDSMIVKSAMFPMQNTTTTTGINQDELVNRLPITNDTLRQFEGCSMALASSICLSLSLIALRLCKRTPAECTILWLSIFSILIGTTTLLLLNEWRLPDNIHDYMYILLNGLCGSIGQWFITSASKIEQSGVIALARTFDIEIAFLYSALLLGEQIRVTR